MVGTLKMDAPVEGGSDDGDGDPAARLGAIVAGRYALHRVLGAGGMGAVYEAENVVTKRRVALKVMLPQVARIDAASERFLREARAASRVEHPNIVDVLDAGQSADGAWYIVQELLDGRELRAELDERGSLSWSETFARLGPVLSGLAAAHRQGIVHRDVKPENIFLACVHGETVPKLIDFGIARLVDGDGPLHLTRSGALLGTPNYMAPEQARGLRDIDARVDVWAMGVVFREALTGERPFHGDNYNALMIAILSAPLPSIATRCPELPPHVIAALDRALARDRDARFRDASELLDALRAVSPEAAVGVAQGASEGAPRRPRRTWSFRVAGYVVAVVTIVALAFTLEMRAPAPAAPAVPAPAAPAVPAPAAPAVPAPAVPAPAAPAVPAPAAAVAAPVAPVVRSRARRSSQRASVVTSQPAASSSSGGILRGLHDR